MKNNIKNLIEQTVQEIINKSKKKIITLLKKHNKKLHFIPSKYRVLGGLLQSMNIQFGNFIEKLMLNLIKNEKKYKVLKKYSGKKYNKFYISTENETLIDNYITKCQAGEIKNLEEEFSQLKKEILTNNKKTTSKLLILKHDIDLLFKDKETNKIYYVEIKYNDDHDTGKFVDINRKLIKTYAYLSKEFNIKNIDDFEPILFFFNNKIMKGNIYIPEKHNIYRGDKFFDKFLTVKYNELEKYLSTLSESDEVIKMFDELYNKVISEN